MSSSLISRVADYILKEHQEEKRSEAQLCDTPEKSSLIGRFSDAVNPKNAGRAVIEKVVSMKEAVDTPEERAAIGEGIKGSALKALDYASSIVVDPARKMMDGDIGGARNDMLKPYRDIGSASVAAWGYIRESIADILQEDVVDCDDLRGPIEARLEGVDPALLEALAEHITNQPKGPNTTFDSPAVPALEGATLPVESPVTP